MSNLATRIARLEDALHRQQSAQTVPVFTITIQRGDQSQPLTIEHELGTWTQQPGETAKQLHERAKAEALPRFKPSGRFHALYLVAKRPSLGRDKWLEMYGPPASDGLAGRSGAIDQQTQSAQRHHGRTKEQ